MKLRFCTSTWIGVSAPVPVVADDEPSNGLAEELREGAQLVRNATATAAARSVGRRSDRGMMITIS